MTRDDTSAKQPQAGVLLYYGYRDLTRDGVQKAVAEWYESTCTELGLVGRVRVARDGVNGTLGGDMEKLKEHMEGIRAHPLLQKPGDEIDMKLAASSGPRNDACRVESGFDRLRVALCKEVVSLGVEGKAQLDRRRRRLSGGGGGVGGVGGSSTTGGNNGDGDEECYVGTGSSAGAGRDGYDGHSHLCGGGGGAAVHVEPTLAELAAPHVSPSRFHELLMSAATAAAAIRRSASNTQNPSPSHANVTPTCSTDPLLPPPAAPVTTHEHAESTDTTVLSSADVSAPGVDTHTGISASQATARLEVSSGPPNVVDGSQCATPVVSAQEHEGGKGECGSERGEGGGGVGSGSRGAEGKGTVLLDARNIYESRIGYFNIEGVEVLRPDTRKFSELPRWIDEHEDVLRGRRILMYCTGGVRCERASAYVRAKGEGFQDVLQLHGGIQRYLEAYPDPGAGLFQGRLFVFDERTAVGPERGEPVVVGSCMLCRQPYDDYTDRRRCAYCRMLVLVCGACHDACRDEGLICERCEGRQVD